MEYVTPPEKLHKYLVKKFRDNFDLVFEMVDYHEWRIKELKSIGGKYCEKDIEKFKPIFLKTKELIYMVLHEIYYKHENLFKKLFKEELFYQRSSPVVINGRRPKNKFFFEKDFFENESTLKRLNVDFILKIDNSYYGFTFSNSSMRLTCETVKIETLKIEKKCDRIYLYKVMSKSEFNPSVSLYQKTHNDGYVDHNDRFSWWSY